MAKDLWTKEQLVVGLAQYCQMPFGKIHARNPDIIALGKLIGRTPGACSRKLGNFGRLDPELQKRNIKGLSNGSKLDEKVWDDYINDRERLVLDSEYLKRQFSKNGNADLVVAQETIKEEAKTEKFAQVKVRLGQTFFRNELLSSYNGKCCITAVDDSKLLIAAHIVKWSDNEKQRLNPKNGLLLNVFHDKCFELGMFSIDDHFKMMVNPKVDFKNKFMEVNLGNLDGREVLLPSRERALPDKWFLKEHRLTRYGQYQP